MKVEIKVPSLGESISEATVCNIIKPSGSFVKMDEEILELETDKVNHTLNAPDFGKREINVKVNDIVKIAQTIGFIDTEAKEEKQTEPTKEEQKDLKDENTLPLDDAKSFSSKQSDGSHTPLKSDKEVRKKMSRLRKIIAEKLVNAKNQSAMLTTFNEVNMESIIQLREKAQNGKSKLGFMPFFIKASVLALKSYPDINAYIDLDEIVYRNYYDIGVAVGTEKGVIVPVIRNVDQKGLNEIESEVNSLAGKARDNKILIEDLEGGSFTISNGGVYGSLLSTPILNPPQSGILGMHAIQKRAVVVDDQIVIKPMMYLALSYDHQIVDGKGAISFLNEVKYHLENPTKSLITM